LTTRLFLLILLCLPTGLLYAQSQANTGSIEGTVSDPSGRGGPAATVTLPPP
jgi:hypothetical protein